MRWFDIHGGFQTATIAFGESIDDAMAEMFRLLKERTIPANSEVRWDHLRIELWPDSGRVIAFPALSTVVDRVEKEGCQLVFDDLARGYDRLADSELADDDFEEAIVSMERAWMERLVQAALRHGMNGVRLKFWSSSSGTDIGELQV